MSVTVRGIQWSLTCTADNAQCALEAPAAFLPKAMHAFLL